MLKYFLLLSSFALFALLGWGIAQWPDHFVSTPAAVAADPGRAAVEPAARREGGERRGGGEYREGRRGGEEEEEHERGWGGYYGGWGGGYGGYGGYSPWAPYSGGYSPYSPYGGGGEYYYSSPGYSYEEPYWGGDEEEEEEGDDPPPAAGGGPPPAAGRGLTPSGTGTSQPAGGQYGFLGVSLGPVLPSLAEQLNLTDGRGVLVLSVKKGSPADEAGLQKFDVITQADGQVVYSVIQLAKLVSAHKGGDSLKLTLFRKGKMETPNVTLGATSHQAWKRFGMMAWHRHMMGLRSHGIGPYSRGMPGTGMGGGMAGGGMSGGGMAGGGMSRGGMGGGMMGGEMMERMRQMHQQRLMQDLDPLKSQMPAETWDKLKAAVEKSFSGMGAGGMGGMGGKMPTTSTMPGPRT